jgi:hypothetical protein
MRFFATLRMTGSGGMTNAQSVMLNEVKHLLYSYGGTNEKADAS